MAARDDERDASLERLIRQALAATPSLPDGSAACLDADLLASWADGTLGANERRAVDAHIADCARCQSLVAAFARSVPLSEPAASHRWWWASSLRWLVPLAAAATAVVVWYVVPGPVRVQRETPAPSAIDTMSTPRADSEVARRNEDADASASDKRSMTAAPRAPGPAEPPDSAATRERAAAGSNRPAPAPRHEELPSAAPIEAPGTAQAETLAKEPVDSVAGTQNALPAPAAPPQLSAARKMRADIAPGGGVTIVSTNPASRWRITAPGAVERSMDGGATWQTQQTGVALTMVAGASPSPSVCWLVGPAGTVLLSTDGITWRRIGFPEAVNLSAVSATDDASATVTAADGRTFVTTDGGRTWTPA